MSEFLINLPDGREVEAIKIHGRAYPLWSKFVLDPAWIGGDLQDLDPDAHGAMTKISKITLEANGPESAMFEVHGQGWSCACDVRYLGVDCHSTEDDKAGGWLPFRGFGGHRWRIRKPQGEQSLCA
jgi:hypothetical protein